MADWLPIAGLRKKSSMRRYPTEAPVNRPSLDMRTETKSVMRVRNDVCIWNQINYSHDQFVESNQADVASVPRQMTASSSFLERLVFFGSRVLQVFKERMLSKN